MYIQTETNFYLFLIQVNHNYYLNHDHRLKTPKALNISIYQNKKMGRVTSKTKDLIATYVLFCVEVQDIQEDKNYNKLNHAQ